MEGWGCTASAIRKPSQLDHGKAAVEQKGVTMPDKSRRRRSTWLRYSLDLHHRRAVVLGDELKVVPGGLALALQLADVGRELVEVDLGGSGHGADLAQTLLSSLVRFISSAP